MIRANEYGVQDQIPLKHVLMSVFNKDGLGELVEGLVDVNPNIKLYSTGGTGREIKAVLGDKVKIGANYVAVEDFTEFPEMDGGLVKTLHPKIHAGILGERGNPAHQAYLKAMTGEGGEGVYFDAVIVNFYDFVAEVAKAEADPEVTDIHEVARGHIDIGGPTMVRAGTKNWHGVAVVSHPDQYANFLKRLKEGGGTTARDRFRLMQDATRVLATDAVAVRDHFTALDYDEDIAPHLNTGK